MKYKGWIVCFCIAALVCFSACNRNPDENEAYFSQINTLIQNETFDIAKVEAGKIALFTRELELIKEIPFYAYDNTVPLNYIRKKHPVLYFVTGGSVDDEQGILFINDADNQIFDGIHTIDRIGGNSYAYSTRH